MAQWGEQNMEKGGNGEENKLIYNELLTAAPRDSLLFSFPSCFYFSFFSSFHPLSPPSTLTLFPPPTSIHSYLSIMSPAKINGTFLILLYSPRHNSFVLCRFRLSSSSWKHYYMLLNSQLTRFLTLLALNITFDMEIHCLQEELSSRCR